MTRPCCFVIEKKAERWTANNMRGAKEKEQGGWGFQIIVCKKEAEG